MNPERRRFLQKAVKTFENTVRVAAAGTAISGGAVLASEYAGDVQEPTVIRLDGAELPWADNETWYLTRGPHADGLSRGVRYAIDVASDSKAIPCELKKNWSDRFTRAVLDGEVIVAGDEKNASDPNHSIVEIRHENGIISGQMHLKNIQVEVGQVVKTGDILGNPSCEIPPGGKSTGAHLHFYVRDPGGKPIPINGLVLSGWELRSAKLDGAGTANKFPLPMRTARVARCGPSEGSIQACGGVRNDLAPIEILDYVEADSLGSAYEQAVISGINDVRQSRGLSEIKIDSRLTQAARLWAKELYEKGDYEEFKYLRENSDLVQSRVEEHGYNHAVREFAGASNDLDFYPDTDYFFASIWAESEHAITIFMNPQFGEVGVGCVAQMREETHDGRTVKIGTVICVGYAGITAPDFRG